MPPTPAPQHDDAVHSEEFLRTLMRRQLKLSLSCAMVFLIFLLGLPVVNYVFPEMMAKRIGGFPLDWLLLGVLSIPALWVLSWVFVRRSIALEENEVAEVRRGQGGPKS